MNRLQIYLNPHEEERIEAGHPWIYNNEVNRMVGKIESGEIAEVYTFDGRFLGQGFLNSASKIFVRMISDTRDEIDTEFFRKRIQVANQMRLDSGKKDTYRLFFAEADGIPGFIVDKYNDYLSIQILILGIEKRKASFVQILVDLFHPKGIYERSDVAIREKEGLPLEKGLLYGDVPDEVVITEGECQFIVDLKNGQKTGTFLDQTANHLAIIPFARNQKVLDCFSHIGNFAIQAKHAGASVVEAVDLSKDACDSIRKNALLNQLEIDIIQIDVFRFLRQKVAEGNRYGLIILDPPAFTKSKTKVDQAYKGYKEINLQALHLLEEGGYLVSASCSQHFSLDLFLSMIQDAAKDAKKRVQLLQLNIQGTDHPTLIGSEETLYLKFVILRVFSRD